MNVQNLHALPTETLLDEPSGRLLKERLPSDVAEWMGELCQEPDLNARCGALLRSLRKQDTPTVARACRAMMGAAARGEATAAATLAGLLAVWAPGETLVRRVRGFGSLRRQLQLARQSAARGETLPRFDQVLVKEFEAVDQAVRELYLDEDPADSDDEIAHCRRVFAALLVELEATGTLGPEALDRFLSLARLELKALEARASGLAGAIDPYSARQVSRVMPLLGEVDADLRDMRGFLDELDETRKVSLFHAQRPSYLEVAEANDARRFLDSVASDERLQPLNRLLKGIDRNSISPRTLAWFTERVMMMGEVLQEAKARRSRLDLVHALLVVLEHHQDGILHLPATGRVSATLKEAALDGVEVGEGAVRVVFDPILARRLLLPYDLPANPSEDGVELDEATQASVKDLVAANLNNTSVLLGLLKNQKVINTPGVVGMVVQRSRNMRVLDVICHSRNLHSGFANKDVPLAILRSPMNIPIKVLRRFISVRYVSKIELKRLAVDRTAVRREVATEIQAFLKSLA